MINENIISEALESNNSEFTEFIDWLTYLDDKAQNRLIGFMKVHGYFDASGDHEGVDSRGNESPAVIVAGFLAAPFQWIQFNEKWKQMLVDADVPYFHATELINKKGAFKGWSQGQTHALIGKALNIIDSSVLYGIGMCIRRDDYARVTSEHPVIPILLKKPYTFCTYRCWETAVDWARRAKYEDSINYVFESGDAHQHEILDAHTEVTKHHDARKFWRFDVGGLTFADGVANLPLQAADFLAYTLYKEQYRLINTPELPQRRTTRTFLEMPGEFKFYTEEHLREYVQERVDWSKASSSDAEV